MKLETKKGPLNSLSCNPNEPGGILLQNLRRLNPRYCLPCIRQVGKRQIKKKKIFGWKKKAGREGKQKILRNTGKKLALNTLEEPLTDRTKGNILFEGNAQEGGEKT